MALALSYNILEPNCSKFNNTSGFIGQIKIAIIDAVANKRKLVILINDANLNDLSYIDYIYNLVSAFKESQLEQNTVYS